MNKLAFIFGLSSLIGLIITGVVTIFAIVEGNYSTQANVLIFSLGGINLALAVVCVLVVMRSESLARDKLVLQPTIQMLEEKINNITEKLEQYQYDYAEVADISHSIQDQLRDRIFELYSAYSTLLSGDSISEAELIDFERTNELFYLFLINNIKTIFDTLTGDKCSVCIKILDEGDSANNVIMVKTFMRDSGSYRERKSSDKSIYEYPYYENTAFKLILSPETADSYYVSDNLSLETTYINMNANWSKYYNATLVCPIRMELVSDTESELNEYSVLGFLCVDNKKGGFNNKMNIQLLAGLSDSLYNHFLLFNQLRNAVVYKENIPVDSPVEKS